MNLMADGVNIIKWKKIQRMSQIQMISLYRKVNKAIYLLVLHKFHLQFSQTKQKYNRR